MNTNQKFILGAILVVTMFVLLITNGQGIFPLVYIILGILTIVFLISVFIELEN